MTKNPFQTNVSTEARVGQPTPVPQQAYAGGWKAVEGIMNTVESAVGTIARKTSQEKVDPRAYEIWNKYDAQLASDLMNQTPEQREAIEKQAAITDQLPANALRVLRRNQALAEAQEKGIDMRSMMKAEQGVFGSDATNAVINYANEEYKRKRQLQIETDNKIITMMTDSGLSVKKPDGSIDRESTLVRAKELGEKVNAFETSDSLYQLAGVNEEAYQYAIANKQTSKTETMNAQIYKTYDDHIVDTELMPLIAKLESIRPETFDRNQVALLNEQIQTRIEQIKDKVLSMAGPEKVKEKLLNDLEGYRERLNLTNINDYSALNTLKQSVELSTLLMKEAASQGTDGMSLLYRTYELGPGIAEFLLPKLFDKKSIDFPEFLKDPGSLRKVRNTTMPFIDGSSPQGRTHQEQKENYSLVTVATLDMINQDATKKYDNPTAIKNGLTSMANSFEIAYTNPKSPIHLVAQADARRNWSNPNFAKAVEQYVPKDSREFEILTNTAARMIVLDLNNEVANYLSSEANEGSIKFDGTNFVAVNKAGTPILLSHTTVGLSSIVRKANEALDALGNIDKVLGAKTDNRKETAELLDEQIFKAISGVSVITTQADII